MLYFIPPSCNSVVSVSSTIRKSLSLGRPSKRLESTNFLANILDSLLNDDFNFLMFQLQ